MSDCCIPNFVALQNMPQLEPSVMDSLFWAVVPVLNAVHPMEEHVQELKQELVQEVEMALVPLQRYLDQVRGVKLQCSSVGACLQRRTWSPALTEQLKNRTACTLLPSTVQAARGAAGPVPRGVCGRPGGQGRGSEPD